ncbi:MAG TPA: lysophospholipid acyltransferase family protein [Candidatus Binatia bacterium]|nr:lysophospholipid acyltransferase family protein [Candidatus Binatia bacterium]
MSLLATLAPPLTAGAVRALGATLRLRSEGLEPLEPLWAAPRPVIYAVWHARILMVPWLNARLARTHGARPVRVLASRSRDGELVARWVARFGLRVTRGSSSRGGAEALRELTAAVRAGEDVAVVPDGPRGPRERLQPGVVVLAALTGAPVVPLGFAARPARRLASWDRFMVPWPFARAAAVFGKPFAIARDAERETACADLERALREVTETADRLVGT